MIVLAGGLVKASDFSGGIRLTEMNSRVTADADALRKTPALFSASAANGTVLQYDAGPVLYFPQEALAGSFWSVRFTPLQSCSLVSISAVSYGGSGLERIHILADSGGVPARQLAEPFLAHLSGGLSLQVIPIPVPIDLGFQDFHIAFEMLTSGAPYLTGDDDGGQQRSCYRDSLGIWTAVSITDFVVRATVRYYGPDMIPPQIEHKPVEAAFSEEEGIELNAEITDEAGIGQAFLHYSVNGGAYSAISMNGTGENFTVQIPVPAAGVDLRYYIEAADGSANQNLTFSPPTAQQSPYCFSVFPGKQIKYDDGSAESFFIVGYYYDENRFAVRLTPSSYPAKINMLRALVNDTTKILLSVFSDSVGVPGRLLAGPWGVRSEAAGKGWINFSLPEPEQPIIEEGDFFVVLGWLSNSPRNPGIGADSSLPDNRSLFFSRSNGWKSWVFNDWMIRAAYSTTVGSGGQNLPEQYRLGQNFPNPFNPSTEIRFALKETGPALLSIYNVIGQKVKTLADREFPAGEYSLSWDGRDGKGAALPSGVYFYQLSAKNFLQTRKMVLIK